MDAEDDATAAFTGLGRDDLKEDPYVCLKNLHAKFLWCKYKI